MELSHSFHLFELAALHLKVTSQIKVEGHPDRLRVELSVHYKVFLLMFFSLQKHLNKMRQSSCKNSS